MIHLRPYQQQGVEAIQNFFRTGVKHCIRQLPTGGGKTIEFCYIASKVMAKNKKVLIFTDRTELLLQASGSLKKFNINAFLIQAGTKIVSNSFNCYIAMAQTFRRRILLKYWIEFLQSIDLVIIDESHIQEFNYLFESGLLDNKHVIGFTATPLRIGKMRQIGLDYEKIISTIEVNELIKQGYLVNCDVYDSGAPDLSEVTIDAMKGDFQEKSMFKAFNSPKLYAGVTKNYFKNTPNTKAIIFCVNIEHVIRTTLEFVKHGVDVKYIVSEMSRPLDKDRLKVYELYKSTFQKYSGKRKAVFEWFEKSKRGILINAGIATKGYDCPSIETVILNRATISASLYLQMLGRGSRIYPRKSHFNVLDFGGNTERHGNYNEIRNWYIWHEQKKGGGLPPLKECGYTSDGIEINGSGDIKKGCRRLILALYTKCPFCEFKYPEKKIIEVDLNLAINKKRFKSIRSMTYKELNEYRTFKKHQMAWLWRQLWYKGKEKAIKEFAKMYSWTPATTEKALNFCKNF